MEEEKPTTIKLLRLASSNTSPYLPNSGGGGGGDGRIFSFTLPSLEAGVDLGAIAKALGLEQSTVRLNGHFLSRSSSGVSSVTWKSLLSFFFSHGFSIGVDGPIHVQGKPLPQGSQCTELWRAGDGNNIYLKRKSTTEDDKPLKKKRFVESNTSHLSEEDGLANDESTILCLKRKLRLDDESPLKKRRNAKDLISEFHFDTTRSLAQSPNSRYASSCNGGHRKGKGETQMIFTIPCSQTE